MTETIHINDVRNKVDFAVITIREDEYEAVLQRFKDRKIVVGGKPYEYGTIKNKKDQEVNVLVTRSLRQGHRAAQQTANELINDVKPKWIVLIGIAGGFPKDEFSLGDVVLASSLVDFSVSAAIEGGIEEFTSGGGPMHPDVQGLLRWLPSQKSSFSKWNGVRKLKMKKPTLTLSASVDDPLIYGPDDHRKKVFKSISLHFSKQRDPTFTSNTLATSNMLVKDTSVLPRWKNVARDVAHIEMEAGGVYEACTDHQVPLLCIRGISDIVGFERSGDWTQFACHSAASFFKEMLESIPREVWGTRISNVPKIIDHAESPAPPTPPSLAQIRDVVCDVSAWVLRYELEENDRIEFAIEKELSDFDEEQSVTLLLGKPGSGKTCLLAKIGTQIKKAGVSVLAIKADMFPHDVSLDQWSREETGLDLSYLDLVQTLASREKVVVLVDQLDALASTVDLQSSRLNELLSFIAACHRLSNVSVISSCRNFDYDYDIRFRRLSAKTLDLELPTWDSVAEFLSNHGVENTDSFPDKFRELLRTPQHLGVYLSLHQSCKGRTFETYHQMLGEFWNRNVTHSDEIKFVAELTKILVDTESIWAPIANFSDQDSVISALQSKGMIERRNNQVRFSHQTVQEYAIARLFAETETSLTDFVLAHQETILKRPAIWAVLNYLRTNSVKKYVGEIEKLFSKELRLHMKFLLIEFICRQSDPQPNEITLIGKLVLNDEDCRLRVMLGISGNRGWFDAFKMSHLPSLMALEPHEQWPMISLLSNAWGFDWPATFDLVSKNWGAQAKFDHLTLRVLKHCGKWNEESLDLAEKAIERKKRNHGHDYQIEELVSVISAANAEEGSRLAAKAISTSWKEADESKQRFQSPLEQNRGWYDLKEIALAAPKAFLENIIPWLVKTAQDYHDGYRGSALNHYVGHCLALEDRDHAPESPILAAIQTSIEELSNNDANEFVKLFRSCWDSDNAVIHRLFISGLVNAVSSCTNDVFEYLMGDPRHFSVGPNHDTQGSDSAKLITSVFPLLNEKQQGTLLETILNWSQYKPEITPCEDQIIWDRESRVHLLNAIPSDFLPDETRQLIEKEKSELQNWNREISRMHSGTVTTIPPITREQLDDATESEILNAFSVPDSNDREWEQVKGGFVEHGGAHTAGDELGKLASENPKRAIELVRLLVREGKTEHICDALRGLSNFENRNEIFELVNEISPKCQDSEKFRAEASRLLQSQCDDDGLPEEMVAQLESWLAMPWVSVVVDGDSEDEWKPEESLLWANLGLVILDTDNSYFTLIALTQGLLSQNEPQGDRWISQLTTHLDKEVSYKTWKMFCDSLRFVRGTYCNADLGKKLIVKLFEKFPQLPSQTFGARLLAQLGSFLDADFVKNVFERLSKSNCQFDAQALGELLTLFALRDPTAEWARELLDEKLSGIKKTCSDTELAFMVGVGHACARLWNDLNKPKDCGEIIKQLIPLADESVGNAMGILFWHSDALPADTNTAEIIQQLTGHIEIVGGRFAEEALELFSDLLPHLRTEILNFCIKLVECRYDELRRREFNAYSIGPILVEISMTLQRFDDTRVTALNLLETLLRAGLDDADQILKRVDLVSDNLHSVLPAPKRRRRRNRSSVSAKAN